MRYSISQPPFLACIGVATSGLYHRILSLEMEERVIMCVIAFLFLSEADFEYFYSGFQGMFEKTVHIPNEEIRIEFSKAIRQVDHEEATKRVRESDQLIYDMIHCTVQWI